MPCYDARANDPKYLCAEVRAALNEATAAACELARVGGPVPGLWPKLSPRTQKWVLAHEHFDRQRKGKKP
jgi:hypothetical protein